MPFQAFALAAAGKLTGPLASKAAETMGVNRVGGMRTAFASVRRAGTISLIGVYGGQADPFPMMDPFDKGVTIRMGQAHVKRWVETTSCPRSPATMTRWAPRTSPPMLPLEQAPHGYEIFQKKQDGCIKAVRKP